MALLCFAASGVEPGPAAASPAASGTDSAETGTPPFVRRTGQGWRLGQSGVTLGGFVTAEGERLDGEDFESEVEGNLFVFYEPAAAVRFFAELELPDGAFERVQLDLAAGDAMSLRVGKFLTPVGRWNVSHAEPLVWTTSEPFLIEEVFDDTVSGAMLHGTVFPAGGALSYALFGSLVDPINVDEDEGRADRMAGAHAEWASLDGWSLGVSYLASEMPDGEWLDLGGIDLLWQPHARLEITAEGVVGRAGRSPDKLTAAFGQAALEVVRTLYLVGRYERIDPAAGQEPLDLRTAGFAWVPLPNVRLKADYVWGNDPEERVERGLRTSLSFLF